MTEGHKEALIEEARNTFQDIKNGKLPAHSFTGRIYTLLEEAGVDASVLDPTGEKTAEETEAELTGLEIESHIERAQNLWNDNKAGKPVPRGFIRTIRESLEKAGVTAGILDNTKPSEAIERELDMLELKENHPTLPTLPAGTVCSGECSNDNISPSHGLPDNRAVPEKEMQQNRP